ncbi:MAG: glutathione S-transferase [Ahrensia sp.]|nr:glutathione S-transferase [Ahrensia sp.]|tara:strand:+ start:14605 stop:15258 length:654 start_codon:yes stop_codon:yes gene_type:complete
MADFTLHCFSESGNSYKVALMLQLCGADWQPQRVAFFSGETRGSAYRDLNEMGEAPVLIDHTRRPDLVLSQSGAILYHLGEHFGKYMPESEEEKREALRWILWDNHKLTSYSATYRFLRIFAGKGDTPEAEFFHARARSAWRVLDAHLADRDWIAADRPTIADFSLCGYLFWPAQIGLSFDTHTNIPRWLDRLRALRGFKLPEDLMPSGQDETTATA